MDVTGFFNISYLKLDARNLRCIRLPDHGITAHAAMAPHAAVMIHLLLMACLACACSARSLSASDDYDGPVPTLSDSLSCLDAALLAQVLDCQEMNTSSARVSLERCSSGGGGGAGLFVMCSKPRCRQGWEAVGDLETDTAPGQDVFRVRLVGPEVHLLDVLYCGQDLAFAQYALTEPGAYHAEVPLLVSTPCKVSGYWPPASQHCH